MLSPSRIRQLRKIVRAKYPLVKFPLKTPEGWFHERLGKIPIREGNIIYPTLRQPTACCAFGAFTATVGELVGLHALNGLDEVEKAILALWLNDQSDQNYTAIIASSAQPERDHWSQSEQVLFELGFVPAFRGYNLLHGPNFVTLWYLQFDTVALPAFPAQKG